VRPVGPVTWGSRVRRDPDSISFAGRPAAIANGARRDPRRNSSGSAALLGAARLPRAIGNSGAGNRSARRAAHQEAPQSRPRPSASMRHYAGQPTPRRRLEAARCQPTGTLARRQTAIANPTGHDRAEPAHARAALLSAAALPATNLELRAREPQCSPSRAPTTPTAHQEAPQSRPKPSTQRHSERPARHR
jgi:hypothetical protein